MNTLTAQKEGAPLSPQLISWGTINGKKKKARNRSMPTEVRNRERQQDEIGSQEIKNAHLIGLYGEPRRLRGGGRTEANNYLNTLSSRKQRIIRESEGGYYHGDAKKELETYRSFLRAPSPEAGCSDRRSPAPETSSEEDEPDSPSRRSPYPETRPSYRYSPYLEAEPSYDRRSSSPESDSSSDNTENLISIGGNEYFSERYEYTPSIEPFCGTIKGGCVITATMLLLSAQGISHHEDDVVQHSERGLRGFYWDAMPEALRRMGSVPYEYRRLSSLGELQTIIRKTGLPVASYLTKRGEANHAIVVERVEDHPDLGKLICILDRGKSYKVTQQDWSNVWHDEDIVPTT